VERTAAKGRAAARGRAKGVSERVAWISYWMSLCEDILRIDAVLERSGIALFKIWNSL
jgi:hypothetical protein